MDRLPSANDLSNFQGFIYIRYFDDIEETLRIIRDCGLDAEKIGVMSFNYERGASGPWDAILLGIASSAAWETIKYTKSKLQERFRGEYRDLQFGKFNAQRLKENVADLINEAPQNLEIVSFECIEGNKFLVTFNSRYQRIVATSTDLGSIINLKMEKETQTRI